MLTHAAHFLKGHASEFLLSFGGIGAGSATIANANHIHDLATIFGSLATIAAAVAAVLVRKNSRGNRRRKPRSIPTGKPPAK